MSKEQLQVNCFIYKGEIYPCKNNVPVVIIEDREKNARRSFKLHNDYQFLNQMGSKWFIKKESLSCIWLTSQLGSSLGISVLRCCTLFFGYHLKIFIPREIYRRASSMYYWLDSNLKAIANLISCGSLSVFINGKEFKLPIPKPYQTLCEQKIAAMQVDQCQFDYFEQWDSCLQDVEEISGIDIDKPITTDP